MPEPSDFVCTAPTLPATIWLNEGACAESILENRTSDAIKEHVRMGTRRDGVPKKVRRGTDNSALDAGAPLSDGQACSRDPSLETARVARAGAERTLRMLVVATA